MKILTTIILVRCLSNCVIAQNNHDKAELSTLPMVDGKINYTEIIQLDSTFKKNDLYINAKKFFVDVFNSGKDVIQLDDKEAGIVIGKGFLETYWKTTFLTSATVKIWHTIKLFVRDGKYKYEITNFSYEYFAQGGQYTVAHNYTGTLEDFPKRNKDNVINQIKDGIKTEILSLKKYMAKKQLTDF